MLLASRVVQVVEEYFPAKNCSIVWQATSFIEPIFPPAIVVVQITVLSKQSDKNSYSLEAAVLDRDGSPVMRGELGITFDFLKSGKGAQA